MVSFVSGNSIAGKSYQSFTISEELLAKVAEAVKAGEKEARTTGTIQSFEVFYRGFRMNLSLGRIFIIPPSVCNDRKDFPTALLYGCLVRIFGGEEISDLIEARIGDSEFDEYSQADFDTIREKLFGTGDGKLECLVLFAPNWANKRDYYAFHFTEDDDKLKNRLSHEIFAVYYDPRLSSAFDAIMTNVNTTKIDVTDVTPKVNFPFLSEHLLVEYPQLQKQASKRKKIALTVRTAEAVTKEVLEPQELDVFEALDDAMSNALIPAETAEEAGERKDDGFKAPGEDGIPRAASKVAHIDENGICPGCKNAGEACSCQNCTCKEASAKVAHIKHQPGHKNSKGELAPWCVYAEHGGRLLGSYGSREKAEKAIQNMKAHAGSVKEAAIAKVSYVQHVPGHKNSKGESAPWVIKDHKDDHIISSHSTKEEAEKHLQQMHAHSGSADKVAKGEPHEVDLSGKGEKFTVHEGDLHKALGIPEDQTISMEKLHHVMNSDSYPEHVRNMARSAIGLKSMNKGGSGKKADLQPAAFEAPFTNVGPGTSAAEAQEGTVQGIKEHVDRQEGDPPVGIAIDETGVPRRKEEMEKKAVRVTRPHPEVRPEVRGDLSSGYARAFSGGWVDKHSMPPQDIRSYIASTTGPDAQAHHAMLDHASEIDAGKWGPNPMVKSAAQQVKADFIADHIAADFSDDYEAASPRARKASADREAKLSKLRPKEAVALDIDSIWDEITEDMGPAPVVEVSTTEETTTQPDRPRKGDIGNLPEAMRSPEPEEEKAVSEADAEAEKDALEEPKGKEASAKAASHACECTDPHCPAGHGSKPCGDPASALLHRVDMDDETGTPMCAECAEDALASGVFREEEPLPEEDPMRPEEAWRVSSSMEDFVKEAFEELESDEPKYGCDQCEMLSINGIPTHELGCPNSRKTWVPGEGWVKYNECPECGSDVREGEACNCMEPAEEEVTVEEHEASAEKTADTADNAYDIDKAAEPSEDELGKSPTVECHEEHDEKGQVYASAKKKADTADNPANEKGGEGAIEVKTEKEISDTQGKTPQFDVTGSKKKADTADNPYNMENDGKGAPENKKSVEKKDTSGPTPDNTEEWARKAKSAAKKCRECGRKLDGVGKTIGCYGCEGEFCCNKCLKKHEKETGHSAKDEKKGKKAYGVSQDFAEAGEASGKPDDVIGGDTAPRTESPEEAARKNATPEPVIGPPEFKAAADVSGDFAEAEAAAESPDAVDADIEQPTKSLEEAGGRKNSADVSGDFAEAEAGTDYDKAQIAGEPEATDTESACEAGGRKNATYDTEAMDAHDGICPKCHGEDTETVEGDGNSHLYCHDCGDVTWTFPKGKAACVKGDELPPEEPFDFGAGDLADIVLTDEESEEAKTAAEEPKQKMCNRCHKEPAMKGYATCDSCHEDSLTEAEIAQRVE